MLTSLKCPSCGATIDSRITSRVVVCEYCDSRFVMDAEHAKAFIGDNAEYDDGNTDPMDVYARDLCAAFLNRTKKEYFEMTSKILYGLGIDPNVEAVYLIHDDTVFKSGKDGFAITNRGMYCNLFGEKETWFTSWAELAAADEVQSDSPGDIRKGSTLKVDSVPVCYFVNAHEIMVELYKLYRKLHVHAKKFNWG